ncbi:MAG: hypothetical protein M3Q94_12745 [Pseudomonadota bacterium]|nr:hypothetical protein [Pseudomonadota bacterium]
MNVLIEGVTLTGNGYLVDFHSTLGSAKAIWTCAKPEIGESFDAELEVLDEVVWGVNVHRSAREICSISFVDSGLCLTGKLVSLEMDGVAVLDLNGSLVSIEIDGLPESYPAFIDIKKVRIALFPTNI